MSLAPGESAAVARLPGADTTQRARPDLRLRAAGSRLGIRQAFDVIADLATREPGHGDDGPHSSITAPA